MKKQIKKNKAPSRKSKRSIPIKKSICRRLSTTSAYPQTIKNELSFVGENLLRGRHKIHPYPAMLHPLLVNSLIKDYAKEGDIIYDPFCGSGVVLLQSSINGFGSIGFDINPLALLIAKVKTQKYDIDS